MNRVLCPNLEDHAQQPEGYIAWHLWAAEMSKTHKQRKCAGCGTFAIWEQHTDRASNARRAEV